MRTQLHSAFILHQHHYRDSSLIMDLFTREFGRIGVVARGARSKRSSLTGLYQPFNPLLTSWFGKGDLVTMQKIEAAGTAISLIGKSLYSGFYINELIIRLLHRNDPHPEMFDSYFETLKCLQSATNVERSLRIFERRLLDEIGYGLLLEYDADTGEIIEANAKYRYQSEYGPVRISHHEQSGMIVSGRTLLSIRENQYDDNRSLLEAKQLMRSEIAVHLGDKPLKSRKLYIQQLNVL